MVICYSSRGELTPQVSGVGGEGKRPSPTHPGLNPALLTRSTATKTCPVVFHQWRGHWVVRRWASPRCFPSGNRQMLVFWGSSPCGRHTGSPLRRPCPASHAPSVQLNAERWGPSVSCEPRCLPRITRLGRPGTRSTIAVATVGSVRLPGPWDARSLAGLCFWAGLASISTSALTPVSRGKRPAVPTVEGLSPPSGRADARRCPSPRPRHRQPALPVLAPGPRLTPSAPGLSGLSPRALPGLQLAHSKGWTSRPA